VEINRRNIQLRAVFFDANGVIYHRRERNRYLNSFLQQNNLERPSKEILSAQTDKLHDAALRGQIPQEEYWNAVLKACGVVGISMLEEGRAAIEKDHGNIRLFPKVKETLAELKERGFLLGIVTDAGVSKQTKLDWFSKQGLDIEWDAYANSKDLKTRKPDVRMFEAALVEAGVTADDTVFVGHDAKELYGARQAGIRTIAFNYESEVEANYFIKSFDDLLNLPFLRKAEA
jgi:putative hydrolase of the HAD superfamily